MRVDHTTKTNGFVQILFRNVVQEDAINDLMRSGRCEKLQNIKLPT